MLQYRRGGKPDRGMSIVELCGGARSSNQAIEKVKGAIQWRHSYAAGDKTL